LSFTLAAACLVWPLSSRAADNTPPAIQTVSPTPGTISNLTQIVVTFTEPVTGVSFSDLLINTIPATDVTVSNGVYIFAVDQPPDGPVQITWDPGHAIFDLAVPPNRFDEAAAGSTWQYSLVDTIPPTVSALTPPAGFTVPELTQIEVRFSEPVAGVDAGDLRINGAGATNVSVLGQGRYLFKFPSPTNGLVSVSWAAGHGIVDFASVPNAFGGGAWTYTLDPNVGLPSIRINEFVAANISGLLDENGQPEDWIELFNRGASAVNLAGYSLSDDPDDPGKWTFPATNLAAGQYLVVFASAKDRRTPGARLHTNFKLNPSGSYLGFFNAQSPRVALTEFAPEFPEQRNNYSYGYDAANALKYFVAPTPGAANGSSAISGLVPPPHFNVERGFFDAPFTLLLNTPLAGAAIRYTTDGTEPTEAGGALYSGPLSVTNTTIFRAAAFKTNTLPSTTVTHTYLFLDQVLRQPNNPPGFPVGPTVMGGFPSDYEMDPEIVTNALYSAQIKDALKALPVISIVCKVDDMFGPVNGLYTHTMNRGAAWERACSAEFILPDGSPGFQANCGVQIQGNANRDPQKQPKHAFRINFKGSFGASRLNYQMFPDSPVTSFDTFVLRADFNNSWLHWDSAQRARGQRTRDAWMKDSQRAMGALASHNRYVHLYINGLYWGVYDPSERPDGTFAASYLGGEKEDYDVVNEGAAVDGDMVAYNAMLAIPNLVNNAQYDLMKQYLDIPQFIDYILLHFYVGHQDWGLNKNWYTMRKHAGNDGFKYVPWDGENILQGTTDNRVSSADTPSGLHTALIANAEYKLAFADRVQKHLFNGGALTPGPCAARWMNRANQIDVAILAESARWGDYRRDVHQYQTAPYELYTRNNQWLTEQNRLLTSYFPGRTATVLSQLQAAGLYPSVAAPTFNQFGGRVARGFNLTMSAPNPIYYTTNGADPRVSGTGAVSPSAVAYSGPVTLNNSVVVKARTFNGSTWSALTEAGFTAGTLGVPLRITEIMYNPVGGDAYEFVELQNAGAAAINIGSFSFDGILYTFPPNTMLAAGATLVLASSSSPPNWTNRYPGVIAFGRFDGSLSNGGEKLALKDASGQVVCSVDYDDKNGWPTAADGLGFSLEIIDPFGDPDDPANWRASAAPNGTPGTVTPPPPTGAVVLNEIMADNIASVNNGGTYPDWIELYNSGAQPVSLAGWSLTDDSNPLKFVFPSTTLDAGGYLVVWCDTNNAAPGLHTGFALGRKGDSVFLYDNSTSRVDAVTFGLQLSDVSVGRVGGVWQLTTPTPNAPNVAAALAATTNLFINEWLANAAPGGEDWIELYNRSTTAPVALRGIYLGTSNATFQILSLSFVPPGGYVQLFADEKPGADHLDFKLPAAGGAIVFYDETGAERNRVTYGPQTQGVSQGRLPDGFTNSVSFVTSQSPAASNYVLSYSGPLLNEILALNESAVTNAAGRTADWVELINTNAAPFDLTGMRLSTDPGDPVQWTFPAGSSIPGNGYLVVWFDGDRPASLVVEAVLNTGHSLNGESGAVYLFNPAGLPVDSVVYGFQVSDWSIGRSGGQWRLLAAPTPGAANSAAATLGSAGGLRLNEWMAAPLSGSDWFEIYNPAAQPVDLSGLYLANSPASTALTQHQLAPLSFIGANGFVQCVADADPSQGLNHVSFTLDADGESIRLSSATLGVIDTVYFGGQQTGVSQGRLPDGGAAIVDFPATPTPAASNFLPLPNAVINEALTHTDPPLEDAIELYNPTVLPANIGGWFLSNSRRNFKKYRIPDGTTLPAGGYAVFYENQFNSVAAVVPFTLNSAHGDQIFLSQADGAGNLSGFRTSVSFGAAENGVSFGRYQTCVGVDFVAMSQRTFGVDAPTSPAEFRTGQGLFNAFPKIGPAVINEIMYHPPDLGPTDNTIDEFVELLNITASPLPLFDPTNSANTWKLSGGIDLVFPTNLTLPAGGVLLAVNFDPAANPGQLAAFRAKYAVPADVIVLGPYSGKLDNGGESVELYRPDTPQGAGPEAGFVPYILVDHVEYDDATPWPPGGDGDGASLQRRAAVEYGNDPLNWVAAGPTAGRANAAQPPLLPLIVVQPLSRAVGTNSDVTFTVSICGSPPFAYRWRFNGSPISGATNAAFSVTNVQSADAGSYTVVISNFSGSVTSAVATLALLGPPSILTQPQSRTVNVGSNVTFSVTAAGDAPLGFQWSRNGVNLSSATNTILPVPNAQFSDAGTYRVVVFNPSGSVTSAIVTLNFFLQITAQPQSVATGPGSNVTFSVGAVGTGALRYQWKLGGSDLPGQTNTTLTLNNVQLADNGNYTAFVTDDVGSVTSQPATLSVLVPPKLGINPVSQTVAAGTPVTFLASAYGTLPLSFRWRKAPPGGAVANVTNIIINQTNCFFTIAGVTTADAGTYTVTATNVAGSASLPTLTSNCLLTVVVPPISQTVLPGSNVTFSARVSGPGSPSALAYQWRFNGTNISGATSTNLTLASVSAAAAGLYTFVVTNGYGTPASFPVALTVITPPMLSNPQMLGDGTFRLFLSGFSNRSYFIQYSTNLVDWTNATTLNYSNGLMPWVDANATNSPYRFYRGQMAP
jgi:hypothetical protein